MNNCYSLICNDNINNTPTHNQTAYFYQYLIKVSHNAGFYKGNIRCCSSLEWTEDCVCKLELSTAMETTLWLSGSWKLLHGTLKTGQRDLTEHGITCIQLNTQDDCMDLSTATALMSEYHWWTAHHLLVPKPRNEIILLCNSSIPHMLQYCNANTLFVTSIQYIATYCH
jgi:hypothetical protein